MSNQTIKQPPTPNDKQPPNVVLGSDMRDFLLDRRVKGVAPKTLALYESALGNFQTYLTESAVARTVDITARVLRHYLVWLEEAGHNTGGVSHIYRQVRAYLRWCADEYNLPQIADAIRKVPGPTPSTDPLDPIPLEHFSMMLAQCTPHTYTGDRDKALLLVLLDTGIRHQELTNLTVGDINLDTGSVLIREGKGGKSRTVFVGAKARRALHTYLRQREQPLFAYLRKRYGMGDTDALWLTDEGTPLTKSGIRQIVARRAQQAGVPEPGLHEFRRAFAINSLRNGMDVITLQRLLGHSTLAVINRYLKLLDDDLRTAHHKYGVVDRLSTTHG